MKMLKKIKLESKYKFNNVEIFFDVIKYGRYFKFNSNFIFILGNPIIGEKINFEYVFNLINKDQLNHENISKINGEFLIIILSNGSCKIINDRFSSIPVFYLIDEGKLKISINFLILFKEVKVKKLNHNKFMEFLYFQRIHGENTYEKSIKSLNSSTILNFSSNNLKLTKYWIQDYKKDYNISFDEYACKLSELIKKSIKRKTSDNLNNPNGYGIFLSGGMDSRTVLGSFSNQKPIAFTLGFSEEGEYRVSRKLTKIKSLEHHFIKLENDHFSNKFEKLVRLSSGLYRFDHAIFFNIQDKISKYVDVVLNSTAFDFWFQGMYIPKSNFKLFNKPTYFNKLRHQKGSFEDDYFNNIPYKYKGTNPLDYVNTISEKNKIVDFIKNEIRNIYNYGIKNGCYTFYDCWDFIINDNISRHYTYSNNLSMYDSCEPRSVAFDNEIFNLFLKTPVEFRFNGRLSKKTLKIINSEFAKIISANHGMKITGSPFEMTMHTIFRKIVSRFSNDKIFRHPLAIDRTWPDPYQYLISNQVIKQKAIELKSSELIMLAMPYIKREKLNIDIDNWLSGDSSGGDILYRLITINEFLKEGYK